MNNFPMKQYLPKSSSLVFGCMELGGASNKNTISTEDINSTHAVVDAALESGIKVFDNADIYKHGRAEEIFGKVIAERPELREQIVIQSKCGVRFANENSPNRYDFSKDWILYSVENSLKRLQIKQLDVLMLHRPDPLAEPEEIAEAFDLLKKEGMVKYFGVSNMHKHQIEFLQSALNEPLIVNQVELSLGHLIWLEEAVTAGCKGYLASNFAGGTLEYCRQKNLQLQAWGSLSRGKFSGRDVTDLPDNVQQTAKLVTKYAEKYEVSREAIVLAWLMRHPANIQPVIGTTNSERIRACGQAVNIRLSREDWYTLFVSSRGDDLP